MSIRIELAQQLITKLSEHLDYNINIMDDQGTIIASRDPQRIGNFHEGAYLLVRDNQDIELVEEDKELPEGMRPGVNLPITYDGAVIGVVGITGHPGEVKNLAYAIKTSVETMVEYEYYKEAMVRRQDTKNQFFSRLLYEHVQDVRELDDFAGKLGYNADMLRVPILYQLSSHDQNLEVLQAVKKSSLHDKQHMTYITVDKDLLIFKPLQLDGKGIFSHFREEVEEYIRDTLEHISRAGLSRPESCYVGTYQNQLGQFQEAYRHTLWLMSHTRRKGTQGFKVHFFCDHVMNYFFEAIPSTYFSHVFSFIDHSLDRSTKRMLMSTIEALRQNNMSIKAASEELQIHRNTISFRMEKIRDLLGLDPMNKSSDLNLIIMLVEYLKVSRKGV